jgi:hypothetical protein
MTLTSVIVAILLAVATWGVGWWVASHRTLPRWLVWVIWAGLAGLALVAWWLLPTGPEVVPLPK